MRTSKPDSILWIRRGFSRMAKLVERDPENTIQYLELLNIQRRLVHSLSLVGQGQEALSLGLDLIVKERAVAAQAGPRQELRYDLPRAYSAMADACRALGKRDEARKWYRSAIGEWEAIISEGHYSPDAASGLEEAKVAEQKLRGPGK
jgi:tetratricopeptide (TPR) repeat protein